MGLLDNPDFAEELLKKALEQYQAKDSGSPMTSGLLSAGLGILAANNGRNNPMSAIGMGGLQGLGAYQQARQAQQKDPMQLMQVAAAAQQLRLSAMQNQWMQGMNGEQAPQFQPAQGLPPDIQQRAYGMFDRGAGEGGQLGQMQSPPPGAMAQLDPSRLYQGIALGGAPERVAKAQMEAMSKTPTKFGPGDIPTTFNSRTMQWEQGPQIPNLEKGQQIVGGTVQNLPGYTDSIAALEGAKSGASERAKADLDMIPVPDGKGGTILMPRSKVAALLSQGAPQAPQPAPQPQGDYSTTQGMRGVISGAPVGDAPVSDPEWVQSIRKGTAQYNAGLGRGISEAEKAAAVQAATQAGELNKGLAEGLGKYSIENLAAGHKVAEEAAYGTLPAIQEVRQKIAAGAFTGGGAETKTAILNQLNGWFGTSIASPQVAQSMALKSALGNELLANAKKLGYNPTDTDARRIDDIIGRQGLSKEALLEIANMQERMAKQAIERHNKRLSGMESSLKERGLPTDTIAGLKVQAPQEEKAPAKSANPQLQSVVEEMRRRGLIQ